MARAGNNERTMNGIGRIALGIAIVIALGLSSTTAVADVDLYLAPQFGISSLIVETDGLVDAGGNLVALGGDDDDSAPLLGLSAGVQVPMNEMFPREWMADIRLPSWPLRFELEAAGARDYDFRTKGSGSSAVDFSTEIDATTLTANAWMDIPLITMARPVQFVFGLGRQPRVRQWLDPASFYLGAGVGFVRLNIDGTDNVFIGRENDIFDFAWNVGAGFGYDLNDRVAFSLGYRYLSLGPDGTQEIDVVGPAGPANDSQKYEMQVHEFRAAIKIRIASFRGVWR